MTLQKSRTQMNSMREMYEARIKELETENAALKARVADLEAQLRLDFRTFPVSETPIS